MRVLYILLFTSLMVSAQASVINCKVTKVVDNEQGSQLDLKSNSSVTISKDMYGSYSAKIGNQSFLEDDGDIIRSESALIGDVRYSLASYEQQIIFEVFVHEGYPVSTGKLSYRLPDWTKSLNKIAELVCE